MHFLIVASLIGCALSAPSGGYGSTNQQGGFGGFGGGFNDDSTGTGYGRNAVECGPGLAPDTNGNCVEAIVKSNVYVFESPQLPVSFAPPPIPPKPEIDYNIVFVHTPEKPDQPDPIVLAPPQQKTVVYVLTKSGELEQKVIEVPSDITKPEVVFVNYKDGENPPLAGGLSLQDVLAKTGQQGQLYGNRNNLPGGIGNLGNLGNQGFASFSSFRGNQAGGYSNQNPSTNFY